MLNKIKLLVDNYLSSGMSLYELDSRKLRQVRLINLVTIWLCTGALALIVMNIFLNIPLLSFILIASTLISIINAFILRKTNNIVFCTHMVLINLTTTVFIGNLLIGGPMSPALMWLLLIPVVSAVIVERFLYYYSSFVLILIAALYLLDYYNIVLPYTAILEELGWLQYTSLALELLIISLCLHNYLQENTNYEKFLERNNLQLQHMRDKYSHMAHHDELTNLANRAQFYKQLDLIQSNKYTGKQVAVFYIDLDKMKYINDTYGHDVGDATLFFIGKRLQRCFRASDIIARIGGDEFAAVVVDDAAPQIAERIAKRIIRFNQKPIKIDQLVIPINLSIGIAIYPKDGLNINEVLKKADKALYKIKKEGGNNYSFYTNNGSSMENSDVAAKKH